MTNRTLKYYLMRKGLIFAHYQDKDGRKYDVMNVRDSDNKTILEICYEGENKLTLVPLHEHLRDLDFR